MIYVYMSINKNIYDDLDDCWFGICFNSNSVCTKFILAGIPFYCNKNNIGDSISIDIKNIEKENKMEIEKRKLFISKIINSCHSIDKLPQYLFEFVFPKIFNKNYF